MRIYGSTTTSVSCLIEGISNNDVRWQTPIASPPIDAIEEFKLQNGLYSAAYGTGTAQVNVAIKSGTNTLHGSAYDFVRNNAFQPDNKINQALNQLQNLNLPLTTPLKQNQFGASLGGPVRLPKISNGKDRSFSFISYQVASPVI